MTSTRTGTLLALASAIAFGLTAPVIAIASVGASAFGVAALLYLGAAIAALLLGVAPSADARLTTRFAGRVLVVGVLGAAVAPVAFAWGLQRTGAGTASLLLNLEAVFTVLLARAIHREAIGARVGLALFLMMLGGVVLTLAVVRDPAFDVLGVVAVAIATLAWASDNTLSRPLAEVRPLSVVAAKGLVGAALTSALAIGRAWPTTRGTLLLLACGATGYGLSLVLYLRAQRTMGAARTGSVFAIAPFVGAGLAVALGQAHATIPFVLSAALFSLGVYLHVSEGHGHRHRHARMRHEHAHRHDDAHHDHVHTPPVVGEHSHVHDHDEREHEHPHAPDAHHAHDH